MTIALSDHETLSFPTAPGANAKQKFEQLKKERLAAHQTLLDKLDKAYPNKDSKIFSRFDRDSRAIAEKDLQDTLEADLGALGEITCPYCLEALPAIEVFDHRKWRKHVKNDLDPYVCLFEECNEADKLYTHSEKWLSHMHQHSQCWRCPSHRKLNLFPTREDYMQHVREAHNFKMGEEMLLILANRSACKTPRLFTSCPLCDKSEAEVDGRLENHVAGHLRSLALKSLPPYEEDIEADVGSEQDGSGGSELHSVKTTDDLLIGNSSYTYGMNDELSKLSETEEADFVNDAPYDLSSRHTDMWDSWERHGLPQTSPQQQQQPISSQSQEEIPPLIEYNTLASNVSQTPVWYSIGGLKAVDLHDLGPLIPGYIINSSNVPGVTEQGVEEMHMYSERLDPLVPHRGQLSA